VSPVVQIVDDDPQIRQLIGEILQDSHYEVVEAGEVGSAWHQFHADQPDLSIVDIGLPGEENGIDLLRRIHQEDREYPVLMISGQASAQQAVEAMKLGAFDYLGKPINLEKLQLLIARSLEVARRRQSLERLKTSLQTEYGFDRLLGSSPIFRQLIEVARRVAEIPTASVLLTGESGTGKELFARAIHWSSASPHDPFVEINCAAVPETLLEAELFGFEKGAFTDAKQRKLGLLEEASGGTFFLDEVGELSLNLQAKFLRVLEDRCFRRLGGTRTIHVQFRLIVATNANLEELVAHKQFREDLYYRLNVIHLHLPPLRERGTDLIEIAHHFLTGICRDFGRNPLKLSPKAEERLLAYHWPGNVRELKNILQRAVVLADGDVLEAKHLVFSLGADSPNWPEGSADPATTSASTALNVPPEGLSFEEVERSLIQSALRRTRGNVTAAARLLKMSREKLRYRIRKFGLRVLELSKDLKEER
jgi:DNA-binding NtrC family response regulator